MFLLKKLPFGGDYYDKNCIPTEYYLYVKPTAQQTRSLPSKIRCRNTALDSSQFFASNIGSRETIGTTKTPQKAKQPQPTHYLQAHLKHGIKYLPQQW